MSRLDCAANGEFLGLVDAKRLLVDVGLRSFYNPPVVLAESAVEAVVVLLVDEGGYLEDLGADPGDSPIKSPPFGKGPTIPLPGRGKLIFWDRS